VASASDLLTSVRAQETAKRTIERALASGRVHHAYLFTGPDGVGKELAAFGLAQALVCERRKEGDWRACGACSACMRAVPRVEERTPLHPDVVVIERGLHPPQAIGRRTAETQDISIDQIRTLVLARSAFAPHEGRAKVFVIRRADELSASAANALLKTLEEPGARTHFVLLTSQPDALLPTILSRTLRVRFAPLPEEIVAELLEARGVAKTRVREIARLAAGSVEAGEALADPEESEARERFVARALDALASPQVEPVLALAEDAKKDKDRLPEHIAALASALAERAADAAREGLVDAEAIAARGSFALTALEHLAGNGNPQLVVEAMLTRMRAI
jgi:DNA polymerase-3 subunit delta'